MIMKPLAQPGLLLRATLCVLGVPTILLENEGI